MHPGDIDLLGKGELLDLLDTFQALDEFVCPSYQIIALQTHHHHLVPSDLLLFRHLNSLLNSIGDGIKVIGIDQ